MDLTGRAEDKVTSPCLKMDVLQSTPSGVGKEFWSTNMDELLRSIGSGEESFTTAGVADGSGCAAAGHGLLRQGSLTLPRTLSTKTIDEVWRDLASGTDAFPSSHDSGPPGSADAVVQLPTFKEMTLEEFLIRAGVVKEESIPSLAPTNPVGKASMGGGLLFDKLPTVTGNYYGLTPGFNQVDPSGGEMPSFENRRGSAGNLGLGIGSTTGVIGLNANGLLEAKLSPPTHLAPNMIGKGKDDLSSASSDPCLLSGGMKGRINVSVEKVVERKHRRMAKNRESAARSRARKQAYTLKLEAEVAKLKQQNEELKRKQAEILEMHKNQAVERVSPQPGAKKQRLRRTQTGPW